MSNILDKWSIRTLDAFAIIQNYEPKPVLAFGNKLLVIGLPKPVLWVAHNDNEAKP